jgi:DNA-binding MarR family transcriptional regulator
MRRPIGDRPTLSPMSLPADHEHVAAKAAAGLERIGQAFRVLSVRQAQEHGLSPIQLQLLLRLAVDPPERRRPGVLAREFDVSPASLSDSLAALERKRLIERRRLHGDRRGFSLTLSPSGRRLARQSQALAEPVEQAVGQLPAEQQLALLQSLYALIAELQHAGVVTVARMCITCRHFRPDVHSGPQPHHCALLDMPLAARSLRIDCPEHERAA